MTIDDVVTKTAVTLATAFVTRWSDDVLPRVRLLLPAVIVGLVLSLIIIFSRSPTRRWCWPLGSEGVRSRHHRPVRPIHPRHRGAGHPRHLLGVRVMLVVYRTGAVKVTPRLTKVDHRPPLAARRALMLLNLVLSLFTSTSACVTAAHCRSSSAWCSSASPPFNFLLDFDQADRALRRPYRRSSRGTSPSPDDHAGLAVPGDVRLLASLQRN